MKRNNVKTLIFIILNIIIISSIHAETLFKANTGPYIGAALNGVSLGGKGRLLLTRLEGPIFVPQDFTLPVTDKNIGGDIFVGYERCINYLWLGVEVIGTFTSLTSNGKLGITNNNSPQAFELRTSNSIGGAIKFGYQLNPNNKLYIKAGFENRRFKINFTDTSNTFANLNKSFNSTAFVPSFGVENDFSPACSLRAEYRIAFYPKKTVQAADSNVQTTTIQVTPWIHYFSLGVIYKI